MRYYKRILNFSFILLFVYTNVCAQWTRWVGGNLTAGLSYLQTKKNYFPYPFLGARISGCITYPVYLHRLRIGLDMTVEEYAKTRNRSVEGATLFASYASYCTPSGKIEYRFALKRSNIQWVLGSGYALRIKTREANYWDTRPKNGFPSIWANNTRLLPLYIQIIKPHGNHYLTIGTTLLAQSSTYPGKRDKWSLNSVQLYAGISFYPSPVIHKAPNLGRNKSTL